MSARLIVSLPPSVNHAYVNFRVGNRIQRAPSKETEQYKKDVAWQAKAWAQRTGWRAPEPGQKLILKTWTFWRTAGRQDTHNRIKILADALEGILYPDDRWVLLQEQDFAVDKQAPRIEIELRRLHDDDEV